MTRYNVRLYFTLGGRVLVERMSQAVQNNQNHTFPDLDSVLGTSGVVRSVSFERSWVYTVFIESCISRSLVFHNDFHWTTRAESLDPVI